MILLVWGGFNTHFCRSLTDELPQLEGEQSEDAIEKYLPWSKELPEEILNFQGTYKEIDLG